MRTVFTITLILTCFIACDSGDLVKHEYAHNQWLAFTMVQCLGNPWERDWLNQDGNEYSDYPRDVEEQIQIARDYYQRQGVELLDVQMCVSDACPCRACSCCSGYTLWLRVSDEFIDTLIDLGFRIEDPLDVCRDLHY